jgi:hypothetical protein
MRHSHLRRRRPRLVVVALSQKRNAMQAVAFRFWVTESFLGGFARG